MQYETEIFFRGLSIFFRIFSPFLVSERRGRNTEADKDDEKGREKRKRKRDRRNEASQIRKKDDDK